MKRTSWLNKVIAFSLLSMLLVVSTLLSSCSAPTQTAQSKNQKTDQKVIRIGYQKNDPFMILKERGTLEKRLEPKGVNVKWVEFQDGPAMLESLNAGSIDVGRTGNSPPIFAQAAGSSLVYIAAGKSKVKGSGILVKKDSSIKTIFDLKGKTVGFAKGSSSHYLIIKAMEKSGLKYSDIKPAFLKPGDGRVAFEKGTIDAWVVWDPFTADAEKSIGGKLLVNGEGFTTDRDFFVSTETYYKDHRDVLKIVMDQVQQSSDWTNTHQEEAAKMISSIIRIDESTILMAIKRREYGVDNLTPDIIKEQQDIADTFFDLKIIPQKIDVTSRMMGLDEK